MVLGYGYEGNVARQQYTPAFVSFRKEYEQYLHLLATLLDVAKVVDDQAFETRHVFDQLRQTQIPLRNQ
jgi:hypothetical protein